MIKKTIVDEIHKTARKNFDRRHVVLKGIDDLWQGDLIDIHKYYKVNKGYKFILVIIDAFSKFAWVVALKSKNQLDVAKAFQNILQSGRVPKNLQTDLGTEFYNSVFKRLCESNGINHYSTYSTKKASIVERLIRTLKGKLYKHFSYIGNYKWVGKPIETVIHSYNNNIHRITKFKPSEVNTSNEREVMDNILKSRKKSLKNENKFKLGDNVRISKYKSIFNKGYFPNWSTEIFKVIKVNNTMPVTYLLEDQRQNKVLGCFYEQELQKTMYPDIYLVEKIIKKCGNKLYVKWLGLSEKDNSWINKKNIV